MNPKIYLETTVISYYTADPSRDVVIAGRQESTRELWKKLFHDFDPYISALVIQEARRGDAQAAHKRLEVVQAMPVLDITPACQTLAQQLLDQHGIPQEYPEDALHIAVATMNGMDALITWNFSHINNPFTRVRIRRIIEQAGYQYPEICSPEELTGETP
jgi:predicted nucleic acid-binding protein